MDDTLHLKMVVAHRHMINMAEAIHIQAIHHLTLVTDLHLVITEDIIMVLLLEARAKKGHHLAVGDIHRHMRVMAHHHHLMAGAIHMGHQWDHQDHHHPHLEGKGKQGLFPLLHLAPKP